MNVFRRIAGGKLHKAFRSRSSDHILFSSSKYTQSIEQLAVKSNRNEIVQVWNAQNGVAALNRRKLSRLTSLDQSDH